MTNKTNPPRFEILVGLHVTDDTQYDQYRAGMTPILEAFGGYFRYDFRVSEMLKGDADDPFNRIFVLSFPDEETKNGLFSDEAYKEIYKRHFDSSVKSGSILASFTTSTKCPRAKKSH